LLLLQIRMSESIIGTQKQMAYLEQVIVQTLRVGFLQTPAYTTFYITKGMFATAGMLFWVVNGIVFVAAVVVTAWVWRTVTVGNVEKKGWVRKMVENEGGKTIARARKFIREVKEWEKD